MHQYYRREFELAPRIIRDIARDQRQRHELAADWFATTLAMMHHHHVTEDEMMYPLLLERAPGALLDRMEEQHRRVATAVDRTEACLSGWRHEDHASGLALAVAFNDLLCPLLEHLDAEEDEVMPVVAEYLSAEEYERQGTSANQIMDPRTLMMAFGAMVEQATEDESRVMLAHPPEHVRRAWHEHGSHDYRVLMNLLRGGLRPIGRRAGPGPFSLTEGQVLTRAAPDTNPFRPAH